MSVVIAAAAATDLTDATHWYETRKSGLGKAFLEAVDQQIARILEQPSRWPIQWAGVRRALVPRFPYCVHYRVAAAQVVVVAVLHGHRDPRIVHGRGEE